MTFSDSFVKLREAQTQINEFFWSSECAYQLVHWKLLTNQLFDGNSPRIYALFGEVDCHAFKPSVKTTRALASGHTPKFITKYDPTTREFATHLRDNLEQICRHVIVRFCGALEIYLIERASPSLNLNSLNEKQVRREIRNLTGTKYHELSYYLEKKGITLRRAIPHDYALLAQACKILRNRVVHDEGDWRPPWKDTEFRDEILEEFRTTDCAFIISYLCDGARHRVEKPRAHDIPLLFFYALFSLTHFANFAQAIENALPL